MGKALQGERVIKGYIGNFRSFRGFSGLLFSKLRLTEIKN